MTYHMWRLDVVDEGHVICVVNMSRKRDVVDRHAQRDLAAIQRWDLGGLIQGMLKGEEKCNIRMNMLKQSEN